MRQEIVATQVTKIINNTNVIKLFTNLILESSSACFVSYQLLKVDLKKLFFLQDQRLRF